MEHNEEQAMLEALPDYLAIGTLLKATPKTEGAKRYVYIEASNEKKDQQNEIVLAKALEASAEYYLKFGNLDIDHYTQIGAKQGIPDYESYDIGHPVDVRVEAGRTFVKGEIRTGHGLAGEKPNIFWSSLTDVNPPKRWYPSVGGAVTGREIHVDPLTKARTAIINAVRWTNIGFSATPVNDNLEMVSHVPFGPLVKSWGIAMKSLTAGYATDSAAMTGGAALRVQSLDGGPHDQDTFQNQFADAFKSGELRGMKLPALLQWAQMKFRLSAADASEFVERFLENLQRNLKMGKTK